MPSQLCFHQQPWRTLGTQASSFPQILLVCAPGLLIQQSWRTLGTKENSFQFIFRVCAPGLLVQQPWRNYIEYKGN